MMPRILTFLLALLLGISTWTPAAHAVNVERVVSPGGIEAWLVQDHTNPMLSLSLAFRGGASVESRPGQTAMLAGMLDEGAGDLDSQSFQGKLEDLSIGLSFSAGKDALHGRLRTLTRHRDTAFDLLRLALNQPRFDRDAFERVRGQMLNILAQESQSPDTIAAQAWARQMFGTHPYATPLNGDATTIKALTPTDLRAYAQQWLARDGLLIGVVGDITPEQLKPLLDSTFGTLTAKHPPIKVPDMMPPATAALTIIERDIPQSVAVFGGPGILRNDPDWYAAHVMNYILGGGGFSSWLMEEVREKRGLAYSVHSYLMPYQHSAVIQGGVATQNSRMKDSLALIKAQWGKMAEQGPSQEELDNAKTYLTGSFPLQQDSSASIASLLVAMQVDQLGVDFLNKRNDFIQAVNLKQVRKVAKRLLNPETLNVVVVGKPEGMR